MPGRGLLSNIDCTFNIYPMQDVLIPSLNLKQDPLILWVLKVGIFYPETDEQALFNPYYLWEFLEKPKDQSLMATSG